MTSPASLQPSAGQTAGVAYSLAASVLFAVLYYYGSLLAPMSGEEIFGWRIMLTVPPAVLFLLLARRGDEVLAVLRRMRREPLLWIGLPASSALLGLQQWLFMWAPVNGYAMDVSLGYFLLPLTLAATSRLVFREPISRMQTIACGVAAIGVACEIALSPSIAWPAFVVCLAYPVYYVLRRALRTNTQGGMLIDMVLSAPAGLIFVLAQPGPPIVTDLYWVALVLGLGLLGATGLGLMIASSQKLSLTLFGLLSYVEPILLVLVALVLGERIEGAQWLTYGAIWLAVALLAWEGLDVLRRGGQARRQATATEAGGPI